MNTLFQKNTKDNSSRRRAFTLIELLVVISIIAILSAIVLAALNSARSSAKYAAVQESLVQMRNQYELQYTGANGYASVMPSGIFGVNLTPSGTGYICNTNTSLSPYDNYCNVTSVTGCSVYNSTNAAYAICVNMLSQIGSGGSFSFGVIGGSAPASVNDYAFAATNPASTSSSFCIRSSGGNVTTTSGFTSCLNKNNW